MKYVLRTTILSAIAAAIVLSLYWSLLRNEDARRIAELEALHAEMKTLLAEKEAMLDRVSRARRIAHITIVDQARDPSGDVRKTTLDFIELDDDGGEIARQRFDIPGNVLFVDTWTAKFPHEDVAHGNPLRGKTLMLLRRIYSDQMRPADGLPIDTPGAVPPGYAITGPAAFERLVWQRFWEIAEDPELARKLGIRVAQGEAVYKPVRVGRTYELTVDAAGGINLVALPEESRQFSQMDE